MRRTVMFACLLLLPLCALDYSTPAQAGTLKALNPQPIPPGKLKSLNPKPIPPGKHKRHGVMKKRH